jgi:hypothetical protein
LFVISSFIRELPVPLAMEKLRQQQCEVVVADPFQSNYADAAAELELPAVFLHNFLGILVAPQNPLFPTIRPFTIDIEASNHSPLLYPVFNLLAPFFQGLSMMVNGLKIYHYPRIMFSSVYARPFLVAGSHAQLLTATPRSVIPLGGVYIDAPRAETDSYEVALPGCKAQQASKILYAAFGTNVNLPLLQIDKLCSAFKQVLATGEVDHVIFAFRPLFGAQLPPCHAVCGGDERISVTSWVNQSDVLFSGRVQVFLTHGGFSSLVEGISSRTPMAMMPVFGDQPENVDWAEAEGFGLLVDKLWSNETVAEKLRYIIKHRATFVKNMENSRQLDLTAFGTDSMAQRGASLLEMVGAEGVDNSLQKLVPPEWAPYAKKGGYRMIHTAATWGMLVWLLLIVWVVYRCSRLCSCCCCSCCCSKSSGKKKKVKTN